MCLLTSLQGREGKAERKELWFFASCKAGKQPNWWNLHLYSLPAGQRLLGPSNEGGVFHVETKVPHVTWPIRQLKAASYSRAHLWLQIRANLVSNLKKKKIIITFSPVLERKFYSRRLYNLIWSWTCLSFAIKEIE